MDGFDERQFDESVEKVMVMGDSVEPNSKIKNKMR